MPTTQQTEELQTVLCLCAGAEWHTLGEAACVSKVKPGTYGSWKPELRGYGLPRLPIAEIFAELARVATDRTAAKRYRHQAETIRYAAKY